MENRIEMRGAISQYGKAILAMVLLIVAVAASAEGGRLELVNPRNKMTERSNNGEDYATRNGDPTKHGPEQIPGVSKYVAMPCCCVQEAGAGNEKDEGERCPDNGQQKADKSFLRKLIDDPTATATALLAFLTVGLIFVGWFQFRQLKDSVRLTREGFCAAYPPHLKISNVSITESKEFKAVRWFPEGKFVEGRLLVTNIGRVAAEILHSHCEVHWAQGTLPMIHPYHDRAPNEFLQASLLAPGQAAFADFRSDGPLGKERHSIVICNNNWRLWIMGYIDYVDSSGVKRRTSFCRRWSCPDERFVREENEDYESEELA